MLNSIERTLHIYETGRNFSSNISILKKTCLSVKCNSQWNASASNRFVSQRFEEVVAYIASVFQKNTDRSEYRNRLVLIAIRGNFEISLHYRIDLNVGGSYWDKTLLKCVTENFHQSPWNIVWNLWKKLIRKSINASSLTRRWNINSLS